MVFDCGAVPDNLIEIELEVVDRAVAWLRSRAAVAADARPLVMGQSRGGELALLTVDRAQLRLANDDAFKPRVRCHRIGCSNPDCQFDCGAAPLAALSMTAEMAAASTRFAGFMDVLSI